ncbi:MAG: hypothetical protein U9R58_01705 [Chloroflexota bacterium]|nr:hypothetical protein [Chloroflexota bacterium]
MDHLVYVDVKARELERLLWGDKSMIVRGAAGRKIPYGRVNTGDMLYLIRNNAEGMIKARIRVRGIYNSEQMTREESVDLILRHQHKLQLTTGQLKRWAGKRYLVLIEVCDVQKLEPFCIDRCMWREISDWLPVGDINGLKMAI